MEKLSQQKCNQKNLNEGKIINTENDNQNIIDFQNLLLIY